MLRIASAFEFWALLQNMVLRLLFVKLNYSSCLLLFRSKSFQQRHSLFLFGFLKNFLKMLKFYKVSTFLCLNATFFDQSLINTISYLTQTFATNSPVCRWSLLYKMLWSEECSRLLSRFMKTQLVTSHCSSGSWFFKFSKYILSRTEQGLQCCWISFYPF